MYNAVSVVLKRHNTSIYRITIIRYKYGFSTLLRETFCFYKDNDT